MSGNMFSPRRFCNRPARTVPVVAVVLLLGGPDVALAAEAEPTAQFWPDRRTLDLLVERLIDEPARERGIDDKRREFLCQRGSKVIVGFLRRDRAAFEPLLATILEEAELQEGWWPSPRVVQLAAEQIKGYLARRYELDQEQRELCGKLLEEGISGLLDRHRATLEPLTAEFILQRAGGDMPTTQKVADWSREFLPVLRDVSKEWDKVYRKMLVRLRPDQRKRWARDGFRNKLTFTMGEAKLRSYAQGHFDLDEWQSSFAGSITGPKNILREAKKRGLETNPPPQAQGPGISEMGPDAGGKALAAEQRPHEDTRGSQTGDAGARLVPPDKWGSYAKQFVKRHQLDEGQKTAVIAVLKEVRERAMSYHQSHAEEFAHLKRALGKAKGDEKTRLASEMAELERPLRDLFEEFQTRLDGLLARSQR